MAPKDEIIVSLIKDFLGKPRHEGSSVSQFEFNCPSQLCRGDNKYNLGYSTEKRVFQCWKCKYNGTIYRLVREFGTSIHLERLKLVLPYSENFSITLKKEQVAYDLITCELPAEYKPLTQKNNSWAYKKAMEYLKKRKIDFKLIQKHNR